LIFARGEPPNSTYIFKHALVQDAAYASMVRSKRQQLHSRIADALMEAFPETVETRNRNCWAITSHKRTALKEPSNICKRLGAGRFSYRWLAAIVPSSSDSLQTALEQRSQRAQTAY
jgi:hypothetical protein